jgi:hypothetical protein
MNADLRTGTPPKPACRCTDEIREHTVHHYERCFLMELCKSIAVASEDDRGGDPVRICQRCVDPRPKYTYTPGQQARANLRGLIRVEQASIPGILDQKVKDFFSAC